MGAFFWLPPDPKTNPDLDPNPKPNLGETFLGAQIRSDKTHPLNTSNSSFKNHVIQTLIQRLRFQNLQVQISRIIQIL